MEDSVSVLKFAECRAKEIMTLMDEVTATKGSFCLQKLPYHMRRRAASHNPKRLPRSLRLKKIDETPAKKKKKRKYHKDLLEEYNSRQTADSSWLPTHIWFAKRFHMKKMWGYQLPLQATGKRFRASYRATVKKALVQDLSYLCCIELRGDQEKLLPQLSLITDDSVGKNFASEACIDGTKEGYCFLYYPKSFPYQAIGPVSFLWKPSWNDEGEHNCNISQQLWIWCHPSIHEELVQVFMNLFDLEEKPKSQVTSKQFHFASKSNFMKTKLHFQNEPIYTSADVTMVLLKNTLVRHRLIGPNALSILTSVLNFKHSSVNGQVCSNDELSNMEVDEKCSESPEESQETVGKNFGNNSKSVDDLLNKFWPAYASVKQNVWSYLTDTKSSYGVPLRAVIGLAVEDPRLYVVPNKFNNSETGAVQSENLTVLHEFSNPSTAVSALWDGEIRNQVTASQIPEHVLNSERGKYVMPKASNLRSCTSRVPVIVIHHPGVNGYGPGWDVIAPQGWGMAFWIPFIYHGAQPAGFDDLCSVNSESGCPTFPCCFPDTKAGAAYEENIRQGNLKKYYRYSRAKRPNFKVLGVTSPFFMPWSVLVNDWQNVFLNNLKSLKTLSSDIFASSKYENNEDKFFVLRNRKHIVHLQNFCLLLKKNAKYLEENVFGFKDAHSALVVDILQVPQNLKCLILVRVRCLFRGTPTNFSGIYLPNEDDLRILKENPRYFGPAEQKHDLNDEYLKMPAKKRRKLLKEEAKMESKSFDRPDVKDIISCTDRKMIGYVSEGGYSRLGGQGCGVGHCVLSGFITVLENCFSFKLGATVLVREQHCSQYRLASIEVIENAY